MIRESASLSCSILRSAQGVLKELHHVTVLRSLKTNPLTRKVSGHFSNEVTLRRQVGGSKRNQMLAFENRKRPQVL